MKILKKCVLWPGLLVALLVSFGCATGREKVASPVSQKSGVLNNFVTELLSIEQLNRNGVHLFRIVNPREGWLFFRSDARVEKSGEMKIAILPEPAAETAMEDLLIEYEPSSKKTAETMRHFPKGAYTLRLHLKDTSLNSLVVRSIPAIIYDHFPSEPLLVEFGKQDWAFLKRIGMLDSCNTFITHEQDNPFLKEWVAQGKQVLENAGVPGLQEGAITDQEAYEYWIKNAGFNNPDMHGIVADEFYPTLPSFIKKVPVWVNAIKRVRKEKPDRLFYPYIAGRGKAMRSFVEPLLDSGCRFAYERYLEERDSEKEAKKFVERELKGEMLEFKKYSPDFPAKCIYVLGFLCGPNTTLNINPAADYKVYLDMQFHMLATDPAFAGLYGVEEYRSSYCDEEYLRWCAKLFRHYCIEGRTEPLTDDPYELDHIRNPDFEQGLKGWTVEAATAYNVQVRKMDRYGSMQGRYPREGTAGNTFLWTKRNAKKPNIISQTIKNLQPGRCYSVKMYTGDYGDLAKDQIHWVLLRVEGAEAVPAESIQGAFLSYYPMKQLGDKKACTNYHRVVFKATSPTARLVISDWDSPTGPTGPVGQEMMYNFIEVEPYLEQEGRP